VAAACEKNVNRLPVRLMFQDEARFGRMSDPRRCWAPAPCRPVVGLALVREFVYVYAAVSPHDGSLDQLTIPTMNTNHMNLFLSQVRNAHPDEFIVMFLDGSSTHRGKDLVIPDNVVLERLPPYSPELNPTELLWNVLRKNKFANRVFDSLDAVIKQLNVGLHEMAANRESVKSLTCWPWINVIMNAK
jgi:transposase